MQNKSYRDKIDEQVNGLRAKLEKVEAAKTFDTTPAGKIIIDHIQECVNNIFVDITSGEPLDREQYLVAHASISLYRELLKTIAFTAASETQVKKDLKDATAKQAVA